MATGSFVGVTPGTGNKLATGPTYTEAGNVVQDEKVILGEPYLAHYGANSNGHVAPPSASGRVWYALNAGASLAVRVRRILISQSTVSTTAAGSIDLGIYRSTSAPVGGTAQTPKPFDPSDPAAGATAASVSNGVFTTDPSLSVPALALFALPVYLTYPFNVEPFELRFGDVPGSKPIVIPAGTANGIALFFIAGNAYGGTPQFSIQFEFTETPF